MKENFNKIIVQTLWEFISNNNFDYTHTSQIRIYTFQNSMSNTKKRTFLDCKSDVLNFNIFEPISKFKWGFGSLHLITFKDNINKEIFNILKNEFMHTEYEDLFFSSINKIIPINYCIENQNWTIVKKLLITKKLQSNGLPNIKNSKLFFLNLEKYIQEEEFEQSLFTFCFLNKSFIKRVECQEYLKKLLILIINKNRFSQFINKKEESFITINNDFSTYKINKISLFSKFSTLVENKKEPVTQLINLLNLLKRNVLIKNEINNLFIAQEEEKFKELIIFIQFNNLINYSFEDYILFLLESYLNKKLTSSKDLEKVSNYYFLNNKLTIKNNKPNILKI